MNVFRFILPAALIVALGCGGGPSASTAPRASAGSSSSSDFAKLCRAVGAEGGKIQREQFLAQAKDKVAAAKLFDACDANQDKILTEEEASQERMGELKHQAIRLTTPTP